MDDYWRGFVAWGMSLEDCVLGAQLGFIYPMSGDARPRPPR